MLVKALEQFHPVLLAQEALLRILLLLGLPLLYFVADVGSGLGRQGIGRAFEGECHGGVRSTTSDWK